MLLPGIPTWLVAGLGLLNLVTAAVWAYDKVAARTGRRRVRERTLLVMAIAGGVVGAWVVFLGLRHKTLHPRFRLVLWVSSVLWAAILLGLLARGVLAG